MRKGQYRPADEHLAPWSGLRKTGPDEAGQLGLQTWSHRRAEESYREKGVAEFRSSVIRVNGKNASPARRRRKEGEKENRGSWMEGGRAGDYIEPRTERHKGRRALNLKWIN